MMQVLEFVFQPFWHFIGAVILLTIIMEGLAAIAAVIAAIFRR